MKNNLILLSVTSAIGISATGQAALIHLDQTEFIVEYTPGQHSLFWITPASGFLLLDGEDDTALPAGFELDGGEPLPWDADRGQFVTSVRADSGYRFSGKGTHTFDRHDQKFQIGFFANTTPVPGEIRKYRLYAGVNPPIEEGNPADYLHNPYTDITLHFVPVPEPASMAVLGLGALALLRRKKKA